MLSPSQNTRVLTQCTSVDLTSVVLRLTESKTRLHESFEKASETGCGRLILKLPSPWCRILTWQPQEAAVRRPGADYLACQVSRRSLIEVRHGLLHLSGLSRNAGRPVIANMNA
ncbi:hypothetical protein M378DRAFT_337980 [Amanita muscaria Koide BX008]|uniref:Uncharacterized protein n=1 Tax=Amanita muscaria (strain Koide BX008) TaxID=946122 RepID=A0A0C2S5Y3_AMAMK|nr:hypothetical protein M378DRAFT_337980 [Amanita muscaria Koide BX008]